MRHSIPVLALACIGIAAVSGCSSDNGPASATVTVRVLTTGSPLDPDGYQVVIGSGPARPIKINDTLTVADVNTGNETVRLDGVAANCGLQSPNPQPAIVSSGSNAIVEFKVVCAANSGMLRVTVTSSGEDIDADGYILHLAGLPDRTVTVNGSEPAQLTPEGTHAVSLSGLDPNCVANPANPTSVSIVKGDSATLALAVTCAHVAAINVVITANGIDLDPDGFQIEAEPLGADSVRQDIVAHAMTTGRLVKVWPGTWRVRIDDVAMNCHLTSAPTFTLTVTTADQQVNFDITCIRLGQFAYTSVGDIYVVKVNGSDIQRLTSGSADDEEPDWSPDGTRIVFSRATSSGQNIGIMNADGSGLVMLTNQSGVNHDPVWSPDGASVAFGREDSTSATGGLYIMPASGGPATRIATTRVGSSSWSPDGSRLVFSAANSVGASSLYTIRRDGTDLRMVVEGSQDGQYNRPAWGPQGRIAAIVFSEDLLGSSSALVTISPDGSGMATVIYSAFANNQVSPDWSADGQLLTVALYSDGSEVEDELAIVRADGSSLASLRIYGHSPDWRP